MKIKQFRHLKINITKTKKYINKKKEFKISEILKFNNKSIQN